jgi:GDP-L-fucose synthase
MSSGLEGKHVTVAGASGFVGTNLLPALLSAGATVTGIVHSSPPRFESPHLKFVEADLSSSEDCRRTMERTDIFIMAAANSSGAQVMAHKPLTHLTPNLIMNALTLEAAYEAGVSKYCFISSNTVYPPGDNHMSEEDVTGEIFEAYDVVGNMKLYSERMVRHYSSLRSKPMATVILRPANLYGPFDKFSPAESKVIAALIRRAAERENPFVVWGNGNDIKDFLYISDFVAALVMSLSLATNHETINIASGASVGLREVVPIILRESGHLSASIQFDASKPTMIPVRRLSNAKAARLLGWKPTVGIAEGLRKTVEWYSRAVSGEL